MRISQTLVVVLGATLSGVVLAQDAPGQGGPAQGAPGQGANNDVKMDVTPFIQELDTNKDGKVSKAEWLAAGMEEGIFKFFDQKEEGFFLGEAVANMAHPAAIDANKDGKMTVAEVKEFIKTLPKPNASGAG